VALCNPEVSSRAHRYCPGFTGVRHIRSTPQSYEKADIAADIHSLVQELGFESITVVGHDIGGMVAYAYAAAYRSEVQRLVLTELLLPKFGLEELMTAGSNFQFHVKPDAVASLRGHEKEYIIEHLHRGLYDSDAITEADFEEYAHTYATPAGMHAGFKYYRALPTDAETIQKTANTNLQMPVLVIETSS